MEKLFKVLHPPHPHRGRTAEGGAISAHPLCSPYVNGPNWMLSLCVSSSGLLIQPRICYHVRGRREA